MLKKISQFLSGKSPIEVIANTVDRFTETKDEKREFFKEVYKMDAEERANARLLYGKDSIVQKIYALVFLIAYVGLTAWLIYAIVTKQIVEATQFETGFLGTIWGAMSAKVNTVTDFFFGAADKNNEKS